MGSPVLNGSCYSPPDNGVEKLPGLLSSWLEQPHAAQGCTQDHGLQPLILLPSPLPSPFCFSSNSKPRVPVVQHEHGHFVLTLESMELWTFCFWGTLSAMTCCTALQQQRNQKGMNQCDMVPTWPSLLNLVDAAFPKTVIFYSHWCPGPFQLPLCYGDCRLSSSTTLLCSSPGCWHIHPLSKRDHNAQAECGLL